jgi:hypothetical protein
MATTPRLGITLPTDATNVTTQFFVDRYTEIDNGALPNSQKGAVNGVASLGADGKVPTAQLPSVVLTSDKGVPNGVASLDGTGKIPSAQVPGQSNATTTTAGIVQLSTATNSTSTTQAATPSAVKSAYDLAASAIPSTQRGAANGVASLDVNGKLVESTSANKVSVTDTANYYASTDVEGTLQEVGSSLASKETPSGAQTKANTAESNAKSYSDTQLGIHSADSVKHVTSAERTAWNAKIDQTAFLNFSRKRRMGGIY